MNQSRFKTALGPDETHRLLQASLGQLPADMVIVNGSVVNVYTKEVVESCTISICGDRIARVGPNGMHTIGSETKVIDASGKVVIPGLVEGHTHLAWLFTSAPFITHAMTGGTTSIITETLEPLPVAGLDGIIDFLESFKDQPLKFWATAPPMVSISHATRGIDLDDLKTLLDRDDILGLGETYWQAVIQNPEIYLPIFHQTLKAGKLVEGHTAGASFDKLSAYTACGVTSCHEPIKAEEVIERLRMGIYVMVREGSIRRDLADIAKIKDAGVDLRRVILSTDGISPKDLIEKGYMDFVLQKAIDCGFDPLDAIQMATLNVAEHFRLDHLIGGLAPGRFADMLILPDIKTIRPITVISMGHVIAVEGRVTVPPRRHNYQPKTLNSIRLPFEKSADDFTIRLDRSGSLKPFDGQVKVVVIEMISDLVTQVAFEKMSVVEHEIKSDLNRDIIKVAAIDRTVSPGKQFNGFIKGFKLTSGAIACSAGWDSTAIIVVGASDGDMALAVNRIRELNGGAVVCGRGTILAELALPVFGLMSPLPMQELADRCEAFNHAAQQLGVSFREPLLTLIALTGAAIPFVRICEEGLIDLKNGRRMDLIVESEQ